MIWIHLEKLWMNWDILTLEEALNKLAQTAKTGFGSLQLHYSHSYPVWLIISISLSSSLLLPASSFACLNPSKGGGQDNSNSKKRTPPLHENKVKRLLLLTAVVSCEISSQQNHADFLPDLYRRFLFHTKLGPLLLDLRIRFLEVNRPAALQQL